MIGHSNLLFALVIRKKPTFIDRKVKKVSLIKYPKQHSVSRVWWYILIIPVLGSQKQVDHLSR